MPRSSSSRATPRGRKLVAGEQPDLLGRADPVDDRLDRPPRQVGQVGVLPALLDPREGQLHAADVRHDLEAVLAQPVAEVARNAVEERVAAADQDRLAGAQRLAHLLERPGISGSSTTFRPAAPRAAPGSARRPGSGRPPRGSAGLGPSARPARRRRSPGSPASIARLSPP